MQIYLKFSDPVFILRMQSSRMNAYIFPNFLTHWKIIKYQKIVQNIAHNYLKPICQLRDVNMGFK